MDPKEIRGSVGWPPISGQWIHHFPFLTVVLCFFVVGEWRKDEISGGDIIYWNLKLSNKECQKLCSFVFCALCRSLFFLKFYLSTESYTVGPLTS